MSGPRRDVPRAIRHRTATVIGIDRITCDGYGMCAEMLPEMIALDDWGYPIIRPGPVPHQLTALARRAVDVCPVLALRLDTVEVSSGSGGRRP